MRYPSKVSKAHLFKLSMPIFFANVAIPLVGVVDTALMGHLSEVKYLASVSIATYLVTMILWSFGFLRMGTTGMVAQHLGKGDYREIAFTILRNLTIAIIIGISIILCKIYVVYLVEYFFDTSTETLNLINEYISIRLLSAPAELAIYVFAGLYIGLQMTKISSILIAFYSFFNIFLSIYFVNTLNLNVTGVALGTVLSAYISVLFISIFTYYFIKQKFNVILRFRKIFDKKKIIQLFNINFDIFIRTLFLTFSFLWFIYLSSKISEDYLAINSILLQFIAIAAFFLDAYAFSTEGVVGFQLGRRVQKSFLFAVKNSFILSFYTGLIISFLYLIFFKQLINMMTDLDYLRFLSYEFIFWIIIIPPIASICYQYDGIFIGTSQTKEMRNCMIFSVILFIFISTYLIKILNNHGLWLSLLLFMIMRSLTLRLHFSNILKRF